MSKAEQKVERNNEIRNMVKEGIQQASVARLFGISRQAVFQILNPEKSREHNKNQYKKKYGFDDAWTEKSRESSRKWREENLAKKPE